MAAFYARVGSKISLWLNFIYFEKVSLLCYLGGLGSYNK